MLAAALLSLAGCRAGSDGPAQPSAGAPSPAAEPPVAVVTPKSGTVVVPEGEPEPPAPEEAGALPTRPKQSFGRAAGLHRVADPLHLQASAALVLDAASGEALYRKNDDAVLPIASLTKLMTGLVVAEAQLPPDETITITADDVDTERNSRSRLRVGTSLSRAEALHLALMSSENRAAHALGRTFPGGLSAFVEAMNARARLLGMEQTTFVDPTGLSNRNQSSVRDVATLAAAAAKHPVLREYSTTPLRRVEFDGRKLLYRNSNRLIMNSSWEIALQKTGYIIEAGQCLAMATRLGEREVILVLLDSASKGSRSADAERLRRWVVARDGGDPAQYARAAQATRVAGGSKAARAKARQVAKGPQKKTQVAKAAQKKTTQVAKSSRQKGKAVAQSQRVRKTYVAGARKGDES